MIRRMLAGMVMLGVLFSALPAQANSVETLPEGIFVLGFKYGFKFATRRFGSEFGTDTVKITNDYNIRITGKDVNPAFSEDDVVGELDVDYENYGMEISFTTAYGITDNLSAMFIVPLQYVNNSYDFRLNNSNMYMVRDQAGNPVTLINEAGRGSIGADKIVDDTPLDAKDLTEALTCTAPGLLCQFRYKEIKDWSRWGIGDIIFGLRYKFMETPQWRQGITLFTKLGTGRHLHPDDIIDTNYGDQNIDIGFWYGIDYMPIKDLTFNISFGYTDQLPDKKEKRVFERSFDNGLEVGTIPLSAYWNKMVVNRDIGGNWDLYFGMMYNILDWLNYSNEFYFFWKYEDNFWAAGYIPRDPGNGAEWKPDFRALEWGTNQSALELTNSLGITTLPFLQKGQFPVPLMFSVGYTVGLAGQNFEQNHTFWASLDLIGSIYMFEDMKREKEKNAEDFKLPGRAEGEGVQDVDKALAEDTDPWRDDRIKRTQHFNNNWGKVNKYGW